MDLSILRSPPVTLPVKLALCRPLTLALDFLILCSPPPFGVLSRPIHFPSLINTDEFLSTSLNGSEPITA